MTQKKLSYYEISVFCRQLAGLFGAGIAPVQALRILCEDAEDAHYESFLKRIEQEVLSGSAFHEALEKTKLFPEYVTSLIRLGEETGSLDVVSSSLSSYYEKEDDLRLRLKSAVSYPLLMVLLMLLVIGFVLRRVLPVFQQVYAELGSSMSGVSAVLLRFGQTLSRYSFAVNVSLAAVLILFLFFRMTRRGRLFAGRLLDAFVPTARLREQIAAGRFAAAMALALKSGLSTRQSLELSAKIVEHEKTREKILKSAEAIDLGATLPDALQDQALFRPFYLRMLEVSSHTGNIDKAMSEIADAINRETDTRLSSLISMIEPTLVIAMSLIVGAILLSVIMPLLGVLANIG